MKKVYVLTLVNRLAAAVYFSQNRRNVELLHGGICFR